MKTLTPEAIFEGGRLDCPKCAKPSIFIKAASSVNGHERRHAECLSLDCDFEQVAARSPEGKLLTLADLNDRPPPRKRAEVELAEEAERSPEAVAARLSRIFQTAQGAAEYKAAAVIGELRPGERFIVRDVFGDDAQAAAAARKLAASNPQMTFSAGNRWGPARISRAPAKNGQQPPPAPRESAPEAAPETAPEAAPEETDLQPGHPDITRPALGKAKPKAGAAGAAETSKSAAADSPVASDRNVEITDPPRRASKGADGANGQSAGPHPGTGANHPDAGDPDPRTQPGSSGSAPAPCGGDLREARERCVRPGRGGHDDRDDSAVAGEANSRRSLNRVEYLQCRGLLAEAWRLRNEIDEITDYLEGALGGDECQWVTEYIYNVDTAQDVAAAMSGLLDRMHIKVEDR